LERVLGERRVGGPSEKVTEEKRMDRFSEGGLPCRERMENLHITHRACLRAVFASSVKVKDAAQK